MMISNSLTPIGILTILLVNGSSSAFSFTLQQQHSRSFFSRNVVSTFPNSNPVASSSSYRITNRFSTPADDGTDALSEEAKDELVGNLIADDEWNGLSMELTEIIRVSVAEDIKKNTREFLGKDDYKVGDISKEIDDRIKAQVANIREKDDYELGDLVTAMDEISKDLTCQWTGKEDYEFGDLSNEIDTRLKSRFADMCGKEEYELGDLSAEMDKRVKNKVAEFTGKEGYEFGDIANEIENRRKLWVEEYLGKDAADKYEFGDITKKALAGFTGKDEYQFGDVTKKLMGNFFGKK